MKTLDKSPFSSRVFPRAESDLPSSDTNVDAIPNEDDSDVDKELRSLRAERRNKRNPNLRKKKTITEEAPIGEVGVDRGFEDIGINKKERYVGGLGGDEKYIDSSECDSDDSTDMLDAEVVGGVDLPGRRKSKKVRVKRARETAKTSQPPPFLDTSIPVTRGITSQLPPRTRQIAGQKRERVETGEDSGSGGPKRPTNGGSSNVELGIYLSASGTQILNPGTSSQRILPTGSSYKDASLTDIDLGFKPRGLR
ncbi:hypothetical protein R3W88_014661 [Solanum pinnatisectum]|uniref:Uncharacterized protein n=1 Tax=Solanum pinnatisectum TaxID=50273 RepID=A0AAV9KTR0_9SOLN|nr:hypothetical protein R3W88_014661 [Solanum pinnatisectum]